MTIAPTFAVLEASIRHLYGEEEYEKIIQLVDVQLPHFPEQRLFLMYWQISMAARMAMPSLSYHYMDQLLQDGLWISPKLLEESPSLASLHGHLDFKERLEKFAGLQRKEQAQLLPLLTLRAEDSCLFEQDPCPLLIGLHDAYGTALNSIRFWQVIAQRKWLVGVPQSSQARWSGAYVWDDQMLTQQEIEMHIHSLKEKYFINARRVVLAGHGRGGEVAAWLPLSGGVDVRGFIALSPYGAFMEDANQWMHLLQVYEHAKLRCAMVVGDQDPAVPLETIQRLVQILNALDVPCYFEVVPGAGRRLDPVYQPALLNALDFILS